MYKTNKLQDGGTHFANKKLQDGGTHFATLLTISGSSSSNSILRNFDGCGPHVIIRGDIERRGRVQDGDNLADLKKFPRWRPNVLES